MAEEKREGPPEGMQGPPQQEQPLEQQQQQQQPLQQQLQQQQQQQRPQSQRLQQQQNLQQQLQQRQLPEQQPQQQRQQQQQLQQQPQQNGVQEPQQQRQQQPQRQQPLRRYEQRPQPQRQQQQPLQWQRPQHYQPREQQQQQQQLPQGRWRRYQPQPQRLQQHRQQPQQQQQQPLRWQQLGEEYQPLEHHPQQQQRHYHYQQQQQRHYHQQQQQQQEEEEWQQQQQQQEQDEEQRRLRLEQRLMSEALRRAELRDNPAAEPPAPVLGARMQQQQQQECDQLQQQQQQQQQQQEDRQQRQTQQPQQRTPQQQRQQRPQAPQWQRRSQQQQQQSQQQQQQWQQQPQHSPLPRHYSLQDQQHEQHRLRQQPQQRRHSLQQQPMHAQQQQRQRQQHEQQRRPLGQQQHWQQKHQRQPPLQQQQQQPEQQQQQQQQQQAKEQQPQQQQQQQAEEQQPQQQQQQQAQEQQPQQQQQQAVEQQPQQQQKQRQLQEPSSLQQRQLLHQRARDLEQQRKRLQALLDAQREGQEGMDPQQQQQQQEELLQQRAVLQQQQEELRREEQQWEAQHQKEQLQLQRQRLQQFQQEQQMWYGDYAQQPGKRAARQQQQQQRQQPLLRMQQQLQQQSALRNLPEALQQQVDNHTREGCVWGRLKVNRKFPDDAFVQVGDLPDIIIKGRRDRRPALDGEFVQVELLPFENWVRLDNSGEEAPEDDAEANGSSSSSSSSSSSRDSSSGLSFPPMRPAGVVCTVADEFLSEKEQALLLLALRQGAAAAEDEPEQQQEQQQQQQQQQEGQEQQQEELQQQLMERRQQVQQQEERVAKRLKSLRAHRQFVCRLRRNVTPSGIEKYVRAEPIDCCKPWVLINRDEALKWISADSIESCSKLFIINVTVWAANHALPQGEILGLVGNGGELGTEIKCVLIAEELLGHAQGQPPEAEAEAAAVVAAAKESLEEEIRRRVDLRGVRRVFTIDPPSARDLDDAVHIHPVAHSPFCPLKNKKKEFELGIHIADVSRFVRQGGDIDKEARIRTATLYLPHMCYPMLPRALADNVCSLHPGGPKLTFSVITRFYEDGTPNKNFKPLFFKSVIESCCRFSYDEVQRIIDGDSLPPEERPRVASGIAGTATRGNGLLRCSCCTGKSNRSKQQQQQQQQQQEQQQEQWRVHDAADRWGDKLESAAGAAAAEPQQGQQQQQQEQQQVQQQQPQEQQQEQQQEEKDQQQQQQGACCSCCELLQPGDPAAPLSPFCSDTSWEDIVNDLKTLDVLTTVMRERRVAETQPLVVHSAELRFCFDALQEPTGWEVEAQTRSHELIEEMMLLANRLVARYVRRSRFSPSAVLRYHPPFKFDERFALFIKKLKSLGVPLNFSSPGSAQQTLKIIEERHGAFVRVSVEVQLRTFLSLARYTPAEEIDEGQIKLCHFALGFEDYTHFTSPIRRYPDVLVHRCLQALIEGEKNPPLDAETTGQICKDCNDIGKKMREADKACGLAVLNIYLRKSKAAYPTIGIVLAVHKTKVQVFLPAIDTEASILYQGVEMGRVPEALRKDLVQPRGRQNSETQATFQWPESLPDTPSEDQIVLINEAVPVSLIPLVEIPATFSAVLIHPNSKEAVSIMENKKKIVDEFLTGAPASL